MDLFTEIENDCFDVAVCQQGLQFFGGRVGALTEARRALRNGGRVGVSVWSEIQACEPFAALENAISEVLGPDGRRRSGDDPRDDGVIRGITTSHTATGTV